MLQALYERDIRPDLFVATSAGALNAAFAAGRPSRVEHRGRASADLAWVDPIAGLSRQPVDCGARRAWRPGPFVLALRLAAGDRAPLRLRALGGCCGCGARRGRRSADRRGGAALARSGRRRAARQRGDPRRVPAGRLGRPAPHGRWHRQQRADNTRGRARRRPRLRPLRHGTVAARRGAARRRGCGHHGDTRAITRRLEQDIARYGGIVDLIVLPAPTLPGVLPTDFGHADELIEQGLRRARAELRRHHAPARSLRRAA